MIRKTLWLALRKQLTGDYGNPSLECEVLLLNDPKMHIVACAYGDVVHVTITYNPLDIALGVRKSREKGGSRYSLRGGEVVNLPLGVSLIIPAFMG